jgi:hypothetical protein
MVSKALLFHSIERYAELSLLLKLNNVEGLLLDIK